MMSEKTPQNVGHCPAVLIVEDEFLIALNIQAMLKRNGYKVLGPAGTIDAALRLLAHEQPDLAVLDVNLNGHAVVPVARRLRSLQVPFVLASAHSSFDFDDSEVLAEAENVGKPFTEHQLLAALERLAAAGHSSGQS
jgi:two-component SAPR family response regulator